MDQNEQTNIAVRAFEAYTGKPWGECGRKDHWMTMVNDVIRGKEDIGEQFAAVKAAYLEATTAPVVVAVAEEIPPVDPPAPPPPDDPNADGKHSGKKK